MCRLFAVISRDRVDSEYYVKRAPQSLLMQSHVDKKRPQGDGWGLGWFAAGRPRIFKSPRAMYRDDARVRSAIRQPEGRTLLGHVRWASNPLKLPRQELIGRAHTQPFSHGSWLFIHNGTLYIPREVKAALGAWGQFVKGRNDSEVLFYWLLKTVVHGPQAGWGARVRASIKEVDRIWQGCKTRYPIYKYPYHGLNWVLTNGKILLAFCYVNPKGFDKGKALCGSPQPYYQLQFKRTDSEIIVASEPLGLEPGWDSFQHGQLIVAKRNGDRISTQKIQVA